MSIDNVLSIKSACRQQLLVCFGKSLALIQLHLFATGLAGTLLHGRSLDSSDIERGFVAPCRIQLGRVTSEVLFLCDLSLDLGGNLRKVGSHCIGLLSSSRDRLVQDDQLASLGSDLFGGLKLALQLALPRQVHVRELIIGLIALQGVNLLVVKFEFLVDFLEVLEGLEALVVVGRVEAVQGASGFGKLLDPILVQDVERVDFGYRFLLMVGQLLDVVGGGLRPDCTHGEVQTLESAWGSCVGLGRLGGIRYLKAITCPILILALLVVFKGSDSVSMSLKLGRIGVSKTPHKVTVSGSQLSGASSYRHYI